MVRQKIEILSSVFPCTKFTSMNPTQFEGLFPIAPTSTPGIYIPVLFIDEKKLRKIIYELDIFTPFIIDFNEKILKNGTSCYSAFIEVHAWHTNETAERMRNKLLANKEVKIVVNDHCYFICKRKHEVCLGETTPPITPTFVDFNHIAPVPRNVKGVSRKHSPPTLYEDCPECEVGIENQMGHTCIRRMEEEEMRRMQEEEAQFRKWQEEEIEAEQEHEMKKYMNAMGI